MKGNGNMAEIVNAAITGQRPWWALYSRHQHEKQVAERLQAKGYETFLPVYESVRRWKDRRKVITLPLFPGYVFVRGMLDRRLGILSTPGVHMILSLGDAAAVIPEEEIQSVRRSLDAKYAVEPHPYLNCGDRVRVTRGALEGIEGILIRKKNMFRLVLSVEMLAQSVSMEIEATDVELVSPAASVSGTAQYERARPEWGVYPARPEPAFRAG
jgi:transcription antitermination factor NusG